MDAVVELKSGRDQSLKEELEKKSTPGCSPKLWEMSVLSLVCCSQRLLCAWKR